MGGSSTHVLLLRAPNESTDDAGPNSAAAVDPYEKQIEEDVSVGVTSVPVYATVQTLNELRWIIESGPAFHGYQGVVVTSKRAVDAWCAASRSLVASEDGHGNWEDIPFYTVGAATSKAVQELKNALPSDLVPNSILGGQETGTGELLARFILKRVAEQREQQQYESKSLSSPSVLSFGVRDTFGVDQNSDSTAVEQDVAAQLQRGLNRARILRPTKFLFLVGDKTRDILPKIIAEEGSEIMELDSVQVYQTSPSPSLSADLRAAIQAHPKVKNWWIAFFAPSGVDIALPLLNEYFSFSGNSLSGPPTSPITGSPKRWRRKSRAHPTARIIAIGPTTATHVQDVHRLDVSAVAAKPNPVALAEALKASK